MQDEKPGEQHVEVDVTKGQETALSAEVKDGPAQEGKTTTEHTEQDIGAKDVGR